MSLKEELKTIHGVGDAKADEILAVVEEHGSSECEERVRAALGYLDEGRAGYARKFLERVVK